MSSLEDQLELLNEKRSSTREKAIADLTKFLKMDFKYDFVSNNQSTLLEALKKSIKQGSSTEQELAPGAISTIAITLGADSDSIFKELSPLYTELIFNSKDDAVCTALIKSLAFLAFIGGDEKETTTITDVFQKVISTFQRSRSSVIEAALTGWSLLISSLPIKHVCENMVNDVVGTFVELLNDANVDVRVAAGEAIALIFEIARSFEGDNFEMYDYSGTANVDDMLAALSDLSVESTKSRAKKDTQKDSFKAITASVEGGEPPSETLSFKHQKLQFTGWVQMIQLDCFRDVLGEGFQIHFENNGLLQEIFDFVLDKNAKKQQLSAVEKRMYFSPNSVVSKSRSKDKTRQRVAKTQSQITESDD